MSSAKRKPTNELNHDNWNDDDEPDESAGEFKKATSDEIKNRVMRVARRRTAIAKPTSFGGDQDAKPSVFSGFGGFVKTDSKPASSPFSFLSSTTTAAAATKPSNPLSTSTATKPMTNIFTGATTTTSTADTKSESITSHSDTEKDAIAYGKLESLNKSVVEWIKQHVDKNPQCILTPIFDDYVRYVKQILETTTSKKNGVDEKSNKIITNNETDIKLINTAVPSIPTTVEKTNSTSSFSFGFNTIKKQDDIPKLISTASGSTVPVTGSLSFSFGSTTSSTSSLSTGFSFGSTGKPFTFENVAKPGVDTQTDSKKTNDGAVGVGDDDGEYVPPEPEYIPVETDSLYSKRCKVFVKKDDDYKSIGVGTLYIKSVDDGKKTQLLVRTDTNQGVVLLNILLTNDTTAKRLGKNNIMMVCLPTPDAKPPPSVVLVRVKDGIEADELLEQMNKYKK